MVTREYLKSRLHYDKDTGIFTWLNGANKGKIAGGKDFHCYWRIKLLGKTYKAHRLAFLYMNGTIPKYIDHINQDRIDNRWDNLMASDVSSNGKNRGLGCNNKSGVLGVSKPPSIGKWVASIASNGKRYYLGKFDTKEEAIEARKEAELKYGFSENHGVRKAIPIHSKRKRKG